MPPRKQATRCRTRDLKSAKSLNKFAPDRVCELEISLVYPQKFTQGRHDNRLGFPPRNLQTHLFNVIHRLNYSRPMDNYAAKLKRPGPYLDQGALYQG